MSKTSEKIKNREKRHKKIRARISGTKERPRISFFKSNKRIYAQLIDDENGSTFFGVSSDKAKGKTITDKAKETGKLMAKLAILPIWTSITTNFFPVVIVTLQTAE